MADIQLVIDAGHGGVDPGAVAGDLQEKTLNWELAQAILRVAQTEEQKVRVTVVPHDPTTLSPRLDRLVNRVAVARALNPDYFLSIHWNSGPPSATGVEAWFATGDVKSIHWAESVRLAVHRTLGLQDRGAWPDAQNRHGRLGILHGHAPRTEACLLEVGFLTHAADVAAYRARRVELARAIVIRVANGG